MTAFFMAPSGYRTHCAGSGRSAYPPRCALPVRRLPLRSRGARPGATPATSAGHIPGAVVSRPRQRPVRHARGARARPPPAARRPRRSPPRPGAPASAPACSSSRTTTAHDRRRGAAVVAAAALRPRRRGGDRGRARRRGTGRSRPATRRRAGRDLRAARARRRHDDGRRDPRAARRSRGSRSSTRGRPARFAGEPSDDPVANLDPVAGHIPGAVNVPFAGDRVFGAELLRGRRDRRLLRLRRHGLRRRCSRCTPRDAPTRASTPARGASGAGAACRSRPGTADVGDRPPAGARRAADAAAAGAPVRGAVHRRRDARRGRRDDRRLNAAGKRVTIDVLGEEIDALGDAECDPRCLHRGARRHLARTGSTATSA